MLVIIVHAERPLLRFTNLKHLDYEQLFMWLCAHPRFVGVDYQHDIGKLKGKLIILITYPYTVFIFMTVDAKVSGDIFLSLNKGSLEHYGLSTEFQTPLMKIIEEVVCS